MKYSKLVTEMIKRNLQEGFTRKYFSKLKSMQFVEDLFYDELENQSPKFQERVMNYLLKNSLDWNKQIKTTYEKTKGSFDSGKILMKVILEKGRNGVL